MSKRKLALIVISILVIFGLGFAGYSSLHGSVKSANNNEYATQNAETDSSSSSSNVGVKKPEKSASNKVGAAETTTRGSNTTKKDTNNIAAISDGKSGTSTSKKEASSTTRGLTCSLTVRGPISQGNKIMLQANGVSFKKGQTVSTVLVNIAKEKHISVAYQGSGSTTYIRGINGLFEFDRGSGSGWLYAVNGKFPGYSSGKKVVKNGDKIQWLYTENLGKDRHAPVAGQR